MMDIYAMNVIESRAPRRGSRVSLRPDVHGATAAALRVYHYSTAQLQYVYIARHSCDWSLRHRRLQPRWQLRRPSFHRRVAEDRLAAAGRLEGERRACDDECGGRAELGIR